MTRRIRLGLLVSLLVSAVLLPASAQPPPPPPPFPFELPPLIRTDPLPGIGTVAYRFTVPEGAELAFSVAAEFSGMSIMGEGLWIYNDDFELQFGAWGTSILGAGFEYHVEAPEPIGVLLDQPPGTGDIAGSSTVLVFGIAAGEYLVFMGATSDGTFVSGSGALYGTEGTTLVSVGGGPGGFTHREADFRGLNVLAGAGGLRAKAAVGTVVEETIDRPAMFGEFSYFGEIEIGLLTVDGPQGTETGMSHLLALSPPGDYRFIVDADVGIGNLYAWGVESAIPPPGLPNTGA